MKNQANSIRFILNDEEVSLADVPATCTLLDWLRLRRRLTGTKEGCAEGDCGACTVLVGRLVGGKLVYESVNACIRLLGSMTATHLVTVEHLAAADGTLHPVQQALVEHHGSQCGFCTPGFVMSLYGLWLSNDRPGRPEIERALQGNLCRCTGYEPIVKAAEAVAETRPSAVFDPIERMREKVKERLAALAPQETIRLGAVGNRVMVPASIEDLATVLAQEQKATIVAGSTDVGLWVTKQMRTLDPVVFINHLPELQAINHAPEGLTLGAGVTYTQAFDALVGLVEDPHSTLSDGHRPGVGPYRDAPLLDVGLGCLGVDAIDLVAVAIGDPDGVCAGGDARRIPENRGLLVRLITVRVDAPERAAAA